MTTDADAAPDAADRDAADRDGWTAANRACWDERVPIHVAGPFYDVEGFLAGRDALRPFEVAELGDVAGRDLVHLQCHFGLDSLSWARRGANVVGLDFSEPAVVEARRLAARAGIDAEFVWSDVYDAPEALGGRRFDVVYTGLGALSWLPDLPRWAEVAASLVKPGGVLYLAEFHPFAYILDDDQPCIRFDYFHTAPLVWDEPGTYADLSATTVNNRTYEWIHPIGEVVSSLIDAGLVLRFLHEHDHTLFPQFPWLEQADDRSWRVPPGRPTMPLMYSLLAARPEEGAG
jgi:SAM-dependent methyltransferase